MAKKQTKTKDIKAQAVKAALALAAEKGWNDTGLSDIAEKAGIPLHALHDHFEDRFDILAAYGRMIDKKVLEAMGDSNEALPPRDRLFDIIMERFDILNEDRESVCAILGALCLDPRQAVISLPHLGRSMSWMLEAAGIDTGGYRGALKIMGLSALYLKTLRTWKDDDSPDMAKTMAALDQNLGRAERWASRFGVIGPSM